MCSNLQTTCLTEQRWDEFLHENLTEDSLVWWLCHARLNYNYNTFICALLTDRVFLSFITQVRIKLRLSMGSKCVSVKTKFAVEIKYFQATYQQRKYNSHNRADTWKYDIFHSQSFLRLLLFVYLHIYNAPCTYVFSYSIERFSYED